MAHATVPVDEKHLRQLRRLSAEEGRPFADLVHEALDEYLARRGVPPGAGVIGPRRRIPEEEWQARSAAVLERLHASAPVDIGDEELEAEIALAREEVRRERAARRRMAGG